MFNQKNNIHAGTFATESQSHALSSISILISE